MQPTTPPSHDDPIQLVLAQYGQTMYIVQLFETMLAALVMVSQGVEEFSRAAPSHQLTEKRARKKIAATVKRVRHLFHEENVAGLLNGLEGRVDADLIKEWRPLADVRHFLAHSYLAVRLGPGSTGQAPHVLIDELRGYAERFWAAAERAGSIGEAMRGGIEPPDFDEDERRLVDRAFDAYVWAAALHAPNDPQAGGSSR